MYSKTIESVPFYFFENLDKHPGLVHFVSTREGGLSKGSHSSLNLSLRVEDDTENVKSNRNLLAGVFKVDSNRLIFSSQTHEDKVAVIDQHLFEKTSGERDALLYGVDALVTNLPEVCLCILTADCASIFLYDPVVRAIGIAHAGWKGTVKKIAAATIKTMQEKYGCKPVNMVAAIGPCICGESFEVGEEVATVFESTFSDHRQIVLRKPEWEKPHVDIVEANFRVLLESGIPAKNIETSGICTFQNPDVFFSARRKADGRFGSGMMIKS